MRSGFAESGEGEGEQQELTARNVPCATYIALEIPDGKEFAMRRNAIVELTKVTTMSRPEDVKQRHSVWGG